MDSYSGKLYMDLTIFKISSFAEMFCSVQINVAFNHLSLFSL